MALAPGKAQADFRLGGADLDGHCRHLGYEGASLVGPVEGPNAAYGWRCVTGSTQASIDVTAACRWEYEIGDAYALPVDVDHAYSWKCHQPDPSPSTVTQLPEIAYHAFDGHTETLVPWQGDKVTLLSNPSASRESAAMTRLITAIDRAYRFYAAVNGHEPAPYFTLNGRTTIAQVTATCGAGCGYIGATGIEIASGYFEGMYTASLANAYDQIPFYELGRNFWFYGSQLAFRPPDQDPVTGGYAVWMRFESMAAARVGGDLSLEKFQGEVESLIASYEANPSLTFAQTLAQNKSPGPYNGTDFWASIMMRLANEYGGEQFIGRFLERVPTLPTASTTADAVTNWVTAASYGACADLSPVFYSRWGFPHPNGVVATRSAPGAVPYPEAGECPQMPTTDESSGGGPTPHPKEPTPTKRIGGTTSPGSGSSSDTRGISARCRAARAAATRIARRLRHPLSPQQRRHLRASRRHAESHLRAVC